jgi:hypothetical protein
VYSGGVIVDSTLEAPTSCSKMRPQCVAVLRAHLAHPGRTGLFAHLHQQLDVGSEAAAACHDHLLEPGQVDAVLAFAVRRAAPVPALAHQGVIDQIDG